MSKVVKKNWSLTIDNSLNQKQLGLLFENIALNFFIKANYQLIDKNWRTKQGEIDLVMMSPCTETLCFIEVKARNVLSDIGIKSSVDYNKRTQIYGVAQQYISKNYSKIKDKRIRIDVVRFLFRNENNNFSGSMEHIINAVDYGFTKNFTKKKSLLRNRYSKDNRS
jgi:putative endonuclease